MRSPDTESTAFAQDRAERARAALAEARTGAMIALAPSEADAERLAVEHGLPADELHVTLMFLGEAEGWDAQARELVSRYAERIAAELPVIDGRLWAIAAINPTGDNPVAAYLVGDETGHLDALRKTLWAVLDLPQMPAQHSPWTSHMSITYGEADTARLTHAGTSVRLDRLRVAFAGKAVDHPLRGRAGGSDRDDPEPADDLPDDSDAIDHLDDEDIDPAMIAADVGGGPKVPAWFEPGDPWLTEKMRQVAEIGAAERQVGAAVEKALSLFLRTARTRIVESTPNRDPYAVDLTQWPGSAVWRQAIETFLFPVLRMLFSTRFGREVRSLRVTFNVDAIMADYLDQVWSRLERWPDVVFGELRTTYWDAVNSGLSSRPVDELLADMLRLDAPSARVRAQIDQLQATIDDPATKASVRREARARLAKLRRDGSRYGKRWWPLVAELTRTLAMSVLNAGTAAGADAYAEQSGEQRYKQWWSAEDNRVRPAHVMAHGQVQPVADAFTVGGFPMRFPGDPLAPPDLTTNCRCSLLTLNASQAGSEQRRYEQTRTSRTDRDGRAIDDLGRVVTAASHRAREVSMSTPTTTKPTPMPAELERVLALLAAGNELPPEMTTVRWRGVLAPLNKRSPDGRVLASPEDGAALHRTLPLPLLYQEKTGPGHDDAVIVGNISRVWVEDDKLMGEGRFDLGNDRAREVVRQIDGGFHRWVSITHDPDAAYSYHYYRRGVEVDPTELALDTHGELPEDIERVRVARNFRISDATLVATPAFDEAAIELLDEDLDEVNDEDREDIREDREREGDVEHSAYADLTAEERRKAAEDGAAMPGGRYPVRNRSDLEKAIHAVGRAGGREGTEAERNAVRRHIIKRARALGLTDMIPDTWNSDGTLKAGEHGLDVDEDREYADLTAEERRKAAEDGAAMPGGRYPVRNRSDLEKAIHAVGRAGGREGTEAERNAVRRHIIKRARALGLMDMIPATWNSDGTLKAGEHTGVDAVVAAAGSAAWCEQVAAAVPMEPPSTWFTNPKLTGPTKVRITDEGRVIGHIAAWDTRHAGFPDIETPRAPGARYDKFHRHPVRCSDGSRVKTGPLATGGHATTRKPMTVWAVMQHYDDPTFVIADVVCGEDEHGIWVSGALRPGVTPLQVAMADRYSFSGDWREGELVAACSVSVPGFHLTADDTVQALAASAASETMPVAADPLPQVRIEDGEIVAMVSAGVILPPPSTRDGEYRVKVAVDLDPQPEEWGRRVGLGMFAGMQEAERKAAEDKRAAELAARVAEFRKRVGPPPLPPEVAALRERVFGVDKTKVGA